MIYDPNNLFARIIKGLVPCDKVYEDDSVFAFHDINPAAPLHVLVLPKGEYCSFDDFVFKADAQTIKSFYLKVRELAHYLGLAESGYRIVMNHGPDASQTVYHYHVHILGSGYLGAMVPGDTQHA